MKRSFVVCLVCVALTFPALLGTLPAPPNPQVTATHPLATRVLHAQSRPRRRRSELVGALAAR